ncbi:MAG: hypothetical protein AAF991_11340, partial [Pseudomonadota bacterium]
MTAPKTSRSLLQGSLVVLCSFWTAVCEAHVKWFIDTDSASVENFQPYSLTDAPVLVCCAVGLLVIALSVVLDTRLPTLRIAESKTRHDFIELLRIFTGMSLLLTAYEGALVAPHLQATGSLGLAFNLLEALIGIFLLANRFIQQAAVLIFLLYAGIVVQFGFHSAIEYFNVFGIGLFLFFNNFKTPALVVRYKPYSVDSLRICTGISLIALALSEKLLGALYGQAFLTQYQWNFMAALGFDLFSDRLFVLAAGITEAVFGVLLIIGTTTRLTMIVVSL